MRKRLEAHVFRDCADERIFSTLVYAACDGITFRVAGKADVTLVESGDFTYPKAPRPNAPPVSLTVDFEKVRPSENVVGRYGSIREALQWCTHVTGKTIDYIMLRLDVRNKPADVYEAEFDSIRFDTKVDVR